MKSIQLILVKTIGELVFVFGLLGWIYGIIFQFRYPQWLTLQLTHLTPWLRVDIFTMISFIASAVGFFIWMVTRELDKA
jgi:hypothetical protein